MIHAIHRDAARRVARRRWRVAVWQSVLVSLLAICSSIGVIDRLVAGDSLFAALAAHGWMFCVAPIWIVLACLVPWQLKATRHANRDMEKTIDSEIAMPANADTDRQVYTSQRFNG